MKRPQQLSTKLNYSLVVKWRSGKDKEKGRKQHNIKKTQGTKSEEVQTTEE